MLNDNLPTPDALAARALDDCAGDPGRAAAALLGTARALLTLVTQNEEMAILALAKILKDDLDELRRARARPVN